MPAIHQCTITSDMTKTYRHPRIERNSVGTLRRGMKLDFTQVKGQKLPLNRPQNDNWGFNQKGNFYFWLGDTNCPKGLLASSPEDVPANTGALQ